MLITKSEVKRTSKKLLSVLLAVIMIMSTMTVGFGTISFAVNNTNALNAFVSAIKNDVMKKVTISDPSKSGEIWTYKINVSNYEEYKVVADVLSKLDAAVKGLDEFTNGQTHNSGSYCTDGWVTGSYYVDDVNSKNGCTDSGYLRKYLEHALGDSILADISAYQSAALFNAVFGLHGYENEKGDAGYKYRAADGTEDDQPAQSAANVPDLLRNVIEVECTDISSEILKYSSIDAIPTELGIKTTYTMSNVEGIYHYTQEEGSGCDKKEVDYYHYHFSINTNNTNGTVGISTTTTATNKATLKDYWDNYNSTYSAYINAADGVDILENVTMDPEVLGAALTGIAAVKTNVEKDFKTAIYNKFFKPSCDATTKKINDAIKFFEYETLAEDIKELYGVDYSRMNEEETLAHLTAFREVWDVFEECDSAMQDLIAETYDLDPAAIRERIQEISDRYDSFRLIKAKEDIQAHLDLYAHLDVPYVDDAEDRAAVKSEVFAALAVIYADKQYIDSFSDYLIADVFGNDLKAALNTRYDELSYLAQAADINVEVFAKYMTFVNEVTPATAEELGDEDILEGLKNYDGWSKQLKDYLASADAALTAEDAELIYDNLNNVMLDYINAAYTALNARVESQINYAWDLYTTFKAAYGVGSGTNINFQNVSHYNHIKQSVGRIDVPAYEFLQVSQNVRISQDAINKYNTLVNFELPDYQTFIDSFGFSEYKQTTIPDLEREDTTDDIARENTDKDNDGVGEYVTTDAEIENVIKDLDALLANPQITKLLGQLLNKNEDGTWTGESFDLGGMLTDLIKGALFTDNMINTIVGMLYPLVVTEFIKVWANDLPAKNGDYDISYIKDLYTIFKEAKFDVYPDLLATSLKNVDSTKYATNISLLNAATANFKAANSNQYYTLKWSADDGENVADKTPWDEAVLKKNVLDEEGKPVLNEDGTNKTEWALDWGVDAKREELEAGTITQAQFDDYFYQTFDDAVDGLKPLLLALLGNKKWSPSEVDHIADTKHKVIITLSVEVGLQLGATANRGYANLIIPVYEALGITGFKSASDLEKMSSNSNAAADILKGILDPIFNFANTTLKNAPLTTILNLLPNLAYALITDMVPELLDMLKTSITYKAVPYIIGGNIDVSSFVDISGGADISVGSMLDLKGMGVDLSDGLNSLLPGFGLNLPNIDQGALATMGELTQISTGRAEAIYTAPASGKAYHIKANKADVLLFLLDYALGSDLLSMFGLEIPEEGFVGELFAKLSTADTREDILAAIVELLNQKSYDTLENYKWFTGVEEGVVLGEVTDPAVQIYLNPKNDWTEAKAQYLYDNIDAIVGAILKMANVDLDDTTEEVDGSIGEIIGGVFSAETLTSLARLLGSISDLNALIAGDKDAEGEETTPDANEPETAAEGEDEGEDGEAAAPAIDIDINALIKEFLGVDLEAAFGKYAEIPSAEEDPEYVYDFGKKIKTASDFAEVLSKMLAPLSPVLDFILEGKNLVINLSETQKVELIGYNGYDSAIVPILEALGCDVKALGSNDALALTLEALAGKIDALVAGDTIKGIIDILPGLFYFVAGNGLSTAIRNLLQPVYVILDTIRPIYDLDLAELLAGIEINGAPLNLDLNTLNLNFVFDLVKSLIPAEIDLGTLLDDVKQLIYSICKLVGTEYDSVSTLAGQTTWKRGTYGEFSQADLITVLLSFVLDWATVEENAEALDTLLNTNGLIASIVSILDTDVKIEYDTPDWMYWFENEAEFNEYLASPSRINTLATLDWNNIKDNDWDLETAQYFADNIDELVDLIIGMINKDKEDAPKTLAALLDGLVNDNLGEYFTDETIDTLIGYISGVLANVDDVLLDIGYELLNVDLVGLKNYKCEKEITTLDEFLAELGDVLDTYAQGLLDLLFFGDDIRLAKKPGTNGPVDTIVINGGFGYEKGLAIILEALGCDVPVAAEATATKVLEALAKRVDAILEAPVNEILDLLPNLVYALNANAAGVAVNNLLQPVNALLYKINGLGLLEKEININELLTVEIGGEKVAILENLQLANIVEIVEGATGLPLDAAADILVNFCTGKISEGKFGYKMAAAREDVITILLYVALELVSDEDFAKALDEMLGTDFIAQIKSVFEPSEITYEKPEWYDTGAKYGEYLIQYPNNWNEATADYVTGVLLSDEFDALIAGLIEDGKYASISELLKDKVNVFTTENLQAIIDLVAGLLGDIDENLLKVGYELLDVDLVGLKNHKVAEVNNVEEFAAELANILGYAKGAVEWLLLGRDFKLLVKDDDGIGAGLDGEAYITISGAQGYANGLALLLEALGCENLPEATEETQDIIDGVLASLATRIDAILADPINEVIDLLPNLVYFLNTNGVAAVIKNTTAAVMALVDKLSGFGVKLDLNELVNLKKLMKIEDTDAAISLDNLSMEDVIVALGYMVGLNLNEVKKVLVGFDLGAIAEYESVSDANAVGTAKKMSYYGDKDSEESFLEHDMVTIIANLALITLADEANADFLKGLVGEDIYNVIVNILNIDTLVPDVKNMNWQYVSEETGGNKVGESITAIETSDLFKNFTYGPNFTKEMADYIAANFGTFVDNIIYLLGIEMDGETYESLSEILKELVGENVYNSANVVAIQDALAGLLEGIATLKVNDIDLGGYIVEVLKKSLDVDITAVAKVEVPEFTKDKDQFVKYLAEVLNPLGAVLKWLLTDEDIAFFVNEGKTDLIKLPGAEGYKTGLVLLLEALGCEDIVAPEALENMTGAEMVIAIIDPLLNKVNNILDDPAEELLAVLPNLIYFINSNGVDVVVKNTLNAVCTLLEAISPVADIDLDSLIYDLVGLSLDEITTEHLIDMLLKDFEIAGFKFTGIEVNDIVGELSVGVLEEYPSLSHEDPAYRMVYDKDSGSADEGDMVTVLLRFIIKFISTDNNKAVLVDLLKSLGMGAEAEKYVTSLFELLVTCIADTKLGMDTALYTIYYIYYGVDLGAEEIATGKRDLNAAWQKKLAELSKDATSEETDVSDLITDIFDIMFNPEGEVPEEGGNDVLDKDGLASNGFLAFFARIKAFFQEIADFFRNLFSFGK